MHLKTNKANIGLLMALCAAICCALNAPLSSILLQNSTPLMAASFFGFGTAILMSLISIFGRKTKIVDPKRHLRKEDRKYLILIAVFDLLENILLLNGLSLTAASTAALCQNFDLVATALIALLMFKEIVPKRLWAAVLLITLGCITVTAGNMEAVVASPGLLLILGACVCLGFSNNCEKKLCDRNPSVILTISGLSVGVGAFIIALIAGEPIPTFSIIITLMLLGTIVYGMANFCQYMADRSFSASKASAIMAIYPFLGAGISLILFNQEVTISFIIALLLIAPGFYLAVTSDKVHVNPSGNFEEHSETKNSDNDADNRNGLLSWRNNEHLTELRNYFTFFGFLMISVYLLMWDINVKLYGGISNSIIIPGYFCGGIIILIGLILIFLRKRDLAGMAFLVNGMFVIINDISLAYCGGNPTGSIYLFLTFGVFSILFAFILLLSSEKKRIFFSLWYFFAGISVFVYPFISANVNYIICGILIAYSIFLAFISLYGHYFRITKCIKDDEDQDFKSAGSMLGFFFIAFSMVPWILYYLNGSKNISFTVLMHFTIALSLFLMLLAIIMLIVGKSHFPGMILFGWSVSLMLSSMVSGPMFCIVGIILFALGLLCLFRPNALLLPGLTIILYGISGFSSINLLGGTPLLITQILLNIIPCVLMIYMAFAVFCTRKKLPVC